MNEIDIWRGAQMLIQLYGADAQLEAAQRADRAIEKGNPTEEHVWKRVLDAVKLLERKASGGSLN